MEAVEKVFINNSWFTLVIVFLFALVFFLKGLGGNKLKGYAVSIFNSHFIETELEENVTFFNSFHILIFSFSVAVISLLLYSFAENSLVVAQDGFHSFLYFVCITFLFFGLKWGLEYVLTVIFFIKKEVRFFLVSKFSYLYSISFLIYIGLILVEYTKLDKVFLAYFTGALFLIRFAVHLVNNKKLIFSKLFYFILYLCAFEIAPLFLLFKLMF